MTSLSLRLLAVACFARLSSFASTPSSETSQRRVLSKLARHALAVSLLVPIVLGVALPSLAATFTVTDTSDNMADPNSLRYAVNHARYGDTIDFSLTYPATITLTSGYLEIATNVTISGPGAAKLFISGNNASRVFQVDSTVSGPGTTLSGVTIEDGFLGVPFGNGGAGIYNAGTLTVSNSTVSGNDGEASGINGGGIYNAGTLTVSNSTVSGNFSDNDNGGGIYNAGTLAVSNSTVSDNLALGGGGGGIVNDGTLTVSSSTISGNTDFEYAGGGILNGGILTVINSTFSGNASAGSAGGGGIYNSGTAVVSFSTFFDNGGTGLPGDGGAIYNDGTLTLKGTVLASSFDGNCGGGGTSDGYNLSDDDTCTFLTATGDQNDVTAGLSPSGLQHNGGPTETIALLPTSPAVNAIPVTPMNECTDAFGNPVKTDQRGVPRPQGPGCDIGAYELAQGQVTASPTSISFGNVELCRTKKVVLTLYNNSTTEAQIGPISFIDVVGNPADFYYIRYCPTNLYPGKSCTVAVMFRPDALTTDTATLSIVTSAPGNPIQVPITAAGSADPNCD